jgi:BirA family biotin operon repressor/biotin-[acetyl-CoA-carboxylase] ligase
LSAVVALPAGRAWTLLPLLAGVAVAQAVTALGAPAEVKWPNDVLIGGLKCCGILVETALLEGRLHAVAGIGLNISQQAGELPFPNATSLAMAGVSVPRERAAGEVLAALDRVLASWERGEDAAALYRRWSATLGREVSLTLGPDSVVTGRALDVAADGQLIVDVEGVPTPFAAGDVQHLRPA